MTSIEIRRVAWLPLAIGASAAVMAVAFCMRTFEGQWAAGFVAVPMTVLTIACTWAIWDGHAALLVADGHGIRLRDGAAWRGLPWSAIAGIQIHPSQTLLTDGTLVVTPVEGEPVEVPIGLVTGYTPAKQIAIAGRLAALAHGRATVARQTDPTPARPSKFAVPAQRFTAIAGGVASGVSRSLRSIPVQRPAAASASAITAVDGSLALNPDLLPEHTVELPELDELKRPHFGDDLPE